MAFRWGIVLCKFNDRPSEPRPRQFYEAIFTEAGAGLGTCFDYFQDVSNGRFDLTGSQVFGWFTMNHPSSDVTALTFPGDRWKLVQWGRDAAAANGVNLSPFNAVLVVQNFGVDHGDAGNGVVIVHQQPSLLEMTFICHEMGHGQGLPHSWSADPDTVYGDYWDIMSAMNVAKFSMTFQGATGLAGPGSNLRNLRALGGAPSGSVWTPSASDFSQAVQLRALNQGVPGPAYFGVEIPPAATTPMRGSGNTYTFEFRRRSGWDQAIPRDAVLVHELRGNGYSYLQPTNGGRDLAQGDLFITPDPPVWAQVVTIDPSTESATVHVWDAPEGSLRKESSDPRVYLIERGQRHWVTTPDVLAQLGRTWSDVRTVPDRGLASIPEGDPIRLVNPRVPVKAHIGVVSRGADHLDIFVTDVNGVIRTAAWEPAFTDWWHGWWEIQTGRAKPGAPVYAASRNTDKLDVFVVGTNNATYTAAWEPAFTDGWHGWWEIQSGRAAPGAPVTAVSRSADKLDVFVVGTDNRVYTAAWEPAFTDGWHGWWPIDGIRVPMGAPVHAVSRSADHLDIFATDINGVIRTAAWEPAFSDGWHGWWEIQSGRAAPGAPVTAVSRSADKLDVFVVGTDNRVYTAAWEPAFTDGWHGWWPIDGIRVPMGAPVHAVSRSADHLDIFATDINGVIRTAAWEPAFSDGWHGWWEIQSGRAAPGAPVTAVSRSADKLDVFVVGTDNRVYTAAWEPAFTDGWHGWWPIGR